MKKIMWLVLAILVIAAVPIVGQESVGDANRFVNPVALAEIATVQETEAALIRENAVLPSAIVWLVGLVGITVLLVASAMMIQHAEQRKGTNKTNGGPADRLKYPSMIPA